MPICGGDGTQPQRLACVNRLGKGSLARTAAVRRQCRHEIRVLP
jgi:hypothetical protein